MSLTSPEELPPPATAAVPPVTASTAAAVPTNPLVSRCRIVLVRPHYAGNLGAIARVMRNFGLHDLVLVQPRARPQDVEARRIAVHGLAVLDQARTVAELGEALAECVYTLATSAETAGLQRRGRIGTPRELLPLLADAAQDGPVALVFGPEPHGLTLAEVNRCHGQIYIPADPTYPSLNLAQAVAICCYEWYQVCQSTWPQVPAISRGDAGDHPGRQPATHAELERMFAHLQRGLDSVGYLFGDRKEVLMSAIRYLIGRARPTRDEVRMLHGLGRQLLWIARRAGRAVPDEPGEISPLPPEAHLRESVSSAPPPPEPPSGISRP